MTASLDDVVDQIVDHVDARSGPAPSTPRPPSPAAASVPVPHVAPDPVEVLIARACASTNSRANRAGQSARNALFALRQALDAERVQREADARAAEEHTRAEADVKRLQEQLTAAKAKLRRRTHRKRAAPPSAGRPIDYDTATVRAWANEHGLECPPVGRYLPKTVVQAWRDATTEGNPA